jgi:HK97 family phage prohead protease
MGKELQPPKDGLVRAARPGLEVRAAEDGEMPILTGYFLRFNEPTEIDSIFEGRFIEKIAPGAAKKTLKENGDSVKILFNHGHDPSIGEKALTKPNFVEDETGVKQDGERLFDTSYNRDLVPGLESGQYGSSFKFRVVKESFDEEPDASDVNPDGLPERTIEEIKLYEAGPVTFPAYDGATAGVRSRSLTDRMFVERAKEDPSKVPELVELFTDWVRADPDRVRGLLDDAQGPESGEDTSTDGAEGTHSEEQDGADEAPENDDDQDGAERAHSEDGSPATTPMSMDSEDRDGRWFEDESEKEWDLP